MIPPQEEIMKTGVHADKTANHLKKNPIKMYDWYDY
jgi:hypothetical protein